MLQAALAAIASSATNVLWVMEHCKARTVQQSSSAHLVWLLSTYKGFFSSPKNSVQRSMQRLESDVPPHLPVQLERLSMRGQGLHPALGLQKPLQKEKKNLQKNPSKTPNFLLHSYFSSPVPLHKWNRTSQAFQIPYHYIANAGFGGLCGHSRDERCHLLFHSHRNAPEAQSKLGFEHKEPTA